MTLQELQKERLEAFRDAFDRKKNIHADREWVESFFLGSTRIAYEAGEATKMHSGEGDCCVQCSKEGYRAGLGRAKELIPVKYESRDLAKPWQIDLTYERNKSWNACRAEILSALDDEIKKYEI